MKRVYCTIKAAIGTDCPYCGVRMVGTPRRIGPFRNRSVRPSRFAATRDHVFPASQGGRIVIVCCNDCNNEKADRSPYAWIEHLFDKGQRARAVMTIEAYCSIRGVFDDGAEADEIIAACDEVAAKKIQRAA